MSKPDIREIIFKAGGPTLVGEKLGIVPNLVSVWMTRNQVPPNWVMTLSAAIGLQPHELRPDIWPEPKRERGK